MAQPGGKGEYRDPQEEEEEPPPPPEKEQKPNESSSLPFLPLSHSPFRFPFNRGRRRTAPLGSKKQLRASGFTKLQQKAYYKKILEKQFECLISPVNSCVCLSFVQTIGEFKNSDCFLPTTFLLLFFSFEKSCFPFPLAIGLTSGGNE